METQCLQAPSVFAGIRVNMPGEDFVGHLEKAAAAEGRRRLFEVHDDVLSRRVRTKPKNIWCLQALRLHDLSMTLCLQGTSGFHTSP